jgi:hypothetical protein
MAVSAAILICANPFIEAARKLKSRQDFINCHTPTVRESDVDVFRSKVAVIAWRFDGDTTLFGLAAVAPFTSLSHNYLLRAHFFLQQSTKQQSHDSTA